jgi:hypothetical protein
MSVASTPTTKAITNNPGIVPRYMESQLNFRSVMNMAIPTMLATNTSF